MLREVAAKRAIVEFYPEPPDGFRTGNVDDISEAAGERGRTSTLLTVIEVIALDPAAVWSDHPDYDPA